ncbi:hypothetical protein JXD20_04585 [Candidatus Peregrinibacteria bacterium]|nr:hypothetical protein [Candidatus Peregrinibacteria bacterium]
MSQQNLTLLQLLDLIELEDFRGIIDKNAILETVLTKGALPTIVEDIRGAVRLAVQRNGDGFAVTQYPTDLALESVGEIYSAAKPANNNNKLAA